MALCTTVMFEKAKPVPASFRPHARGSRPVHAGSAERFESRSSRRAGDALRSVEWGEITARLNAARDLRLLLRNESQAPIEMVAASFGDAAASYFALLDDSEPDVNPDGLDQSKVLDAMDDDNEANRPGHTAADTAAEAEGDAREMQ